MSLDRTLAIRGPRWATLALVAVALVVGLSARAEAQRGLFQSRGVGGVLIDANGFVVNARPEVRKELHRTLAGDLQSMPEGMDEKTGMRKVSLKRLVAAVRKLQENGEPMPQAVQCLAGLQQVRYIVLYPEQNDILLIGPGEGWKVDEHGALVGKTTGRPVMFLDDLVVALRSAYSANPSVISVSINPTREGLQRLRSFSRGLRPGMNPRVAARAIEQQLGPQQVAVTGVDATTHFARVIFAADYRMKRISMGVEPAPVPDLPSFMTMMQAGRAGLKNTLPRWWLAPHYQPLGRDAEGLVWELRGASVQTLTENDFLDAQGVRHEMGRADAVSQGWAEKMTARYEDLAQADPVFAQLQNCIDLAIVGALIRRENLSDKAHCDLSPLLGYQTADLPAPRQIASEAAVFNRGKWMVACGGVQINPWAIVEEREVDESLSGVRTEAAVDPSSDRWWE